MDLQLQIQSLQSQINSMQIQIQNLTLGGGIGSNSGDPLIGII